MPQRGRRGRRGKGKMGPREGEERDEERKAADHGQKREKLLLKSVYRGADINVPVLTRCLPLTHRALSRRDRSCTRQLLLCLPPLFSHFHCFHSPIFHCQPFVDHTNQKWDNRCRLRSTREEMERDSSGLPCCPLLRPPL